VLPRRRGVLRRRGSGRIVTGPARPRARRIPAYWHSAVAVLAMVAVFGLLASQFSPWLGAAFVGVSLATLGAVVLARRRNLHRLQRKLALTLTAILTAALVAGVTVVIVQLVDAELITRCIGQSASPSPPALLGTAAVIWLLNVLLFAFWYWEIDAGGPAERHRSGPYQSADLVFPQRQHDGADEWIPEFLDYLFFAFNSSTAFSPTDTLVMSRRMKVLMMVQSLVSLAILAVVAARAVNALAGP
jgi:uncharacterized membrane protein